MINWNIDIWKDQLGDPSLYHVVPRGEGFAVALKGSDDPKFLVGENFDLIPVPSRSAGFSAFPGKFEFSVHVDNG